MIIDDLLIRAWFRLRRRTRARVTHTHDGADTTWTVHLATTTARGGRITGTVTAASALTVLRLADRLAVAADATADDWTAAIRAARDAGASIDYSRGPGR